MKRTTIFILFLATIALCVGQELNLKAWRKRNITVAKKQIIPVRRDILVGEYYWDQAVNGGVLQDMIWPNMADVASNSDVLHFHQSTDSAKPTIATDCIRFTGTAECGMYTLASYSRSNWPSLEGWGTMFTVVRRPDSLANTVQYFYHHMAGGIGTHDAIQPKYQAGQEYPAGSWYQAACNHDGVNWPYTSPIPPTKDVWHQMTYFPSPITSWRPIYVYQDGVMVASSATGIFQDNNGGTPGTYPLRLSVGNSYYFTTTPPSPWGAYASKIDIKAIVYYSDFLSDAERLRVEAWLRQRCGI